jgi:hypothetical protein
MDNPETLLTLSTQDTEQINDREQQLSCYVSALLVPCFDARRLTRRVPLLTLPDHLSSPPVFSVVRVTRSLVLCVCFVDRCLSLCTFSFDHCVVCSSSIYDSDYPFGIFELFSDNMGNTRHRTNKC